MLGHIATAVPVRAMDSISSSPIPSACASSTFGPSAPIFSRYPVGVVPWAAWESLRAAAPLLWCSVSPVPVSSAMRLDATMSSGVQVSAENGIAHARMRPSSFLSHFRTKAAVRPIASLVG